MRHPYVSYYNPPLFETIPNHCSLHYHLSPQAGIGMRRKLRSSQRSNDWACAWFKHFRWPFLVTFPFHHAKFPRSTSASRAISVLSLIILPLQTFFSRVLLLRQWAFSSGNLPPERPTTTTAAIKKIHYCCRDSFLLKKIYERDLIPAKWKQIREI